MKQPIGKGFKLENFRGSEAVIYLNGLEYDGKFYAPDEKLPVDNSMPYNPFPEYQQFVWLAVSIWHTQNKEKYSSGEAYYSDASKAHEVAEFFEQAWGIAGLRKTEL